MEQQRHPDAGSRCPLKTLPQERADAARKWLEDHGVDAARLRN